jgi:hypothetical protein
VADSGSARVTQASRVPSGTPSRRRLPLGGRGLGQGVPAGEHRHRIHATDADAAAARQAHPGPPRGRGQRLADTPRDRRACPVDEPDDRLLAGLWPARHARRGDDELRARPPTAGALVPDAPAGRGRHRRGLHRARNDRPVHAEHRENPRAGEHVEQPECGRGERHGERPAPLRVGGEQHPASRAYAPALAAAAART